MKDWQKAKNGPPDGYQIHYIEHEFLAMDADCPNIDPRWEESLRVIVLRHPIERHLSEFFFSGPGKEFYPINKQQLYKNATYTNELASFMKEWVPKWMNHRGKRGKVKEGDKFNSSRYRIVYSSFSLIIYVP